MEHKMLWGSLAIGCAGWLCLLLLSLRCTEAQVTFNNSIPRDKTTSVFIGLSLALPIAVWLATLPTNAPFSSGQGWGRGFLLGGLISFLSAFVVLHIGKTSDNEKYFALTSLFGALIVACVPLLWMRHAVIEALLGASLGWCVVALVWLCAPSTPASRVASSSKGLGLLNGAASATMLCAVAALGVYRDFVVADVARGTHSAIAVVIAVAIGLALLFGMLLGEASNREEKSVTGILQVIAATLCVAAPLALGGVLATRVLDDLKVVYCLGVGSLLCLLGCLLLWNGLRQSEEQNSRAPIIPPVAVLVALCAFMLSYSWLQGFGVGLMILAAWPVSLLLWPVDSRQSSATKVRFNVAQTASLIGTFLVVLLVSRVFATRFRVDLRGVSLVDQFALFGFLIGAMVPTWLASLWFGNKEARVSPVASVLQLVAIGILTLLLPGAMLAIWGIKIVPAFFAGMALALVGWGGEAKNSARSSALAVFALVLSTLLTQWTLPFLPLAEASRSQRLHLLLWGLGGSIALVVLVDLSARLLIHFQKRNQLVANESSQGVSS